MRRRWMVFVLIALVLAPTGCGATGGAENPDGQEQEDTVEKSTSLGRASFLLGFGEGSLWLTDHGDYACDDTPGVASDGGGASALAGCVAPGETFLRRVDPESHKVMSTVRFEGTDAAGLAVGADAIWLALNENAPGSGTVTKLDPDTNRVTDDIPVESPSGIEFGGGSLWVASQTGDVSRIDPEGGEVQAKIQVAAGGASDVAVDEEFGAVWVAVRGAPEAGTELSPEDYESDTRPEPNEDFKLVRIDLETNQVVAEVPIQESAIEGGASSAAVAGGAVWVTSVNGRLLRVDPGTNEVVAGLPLGDYSFDVEASEGAVWAASEVNVDDYASYTHRLTRVDPTSNRIVDSVDVKNVSGLALSGSEAWATTGNTETGEGSLISLTP